ncbi:hypothetical protein G6F64_014160 [Rhizopus arrhizus]|uniref:HTH lysR-type domain-containing protein n=1 Tax=Rhizopus oryzae TaxID=64495 RepID=A0A9P6WU76_RHIOR|nr:hypothetical protein G6F64_014160 [Rhizopus arrhizus]
MAAADEHVSQSAVTNAVLALEAQLGVRLFDRHPHGVTLTPEGEALLKTATQVVEQMGLVRHRIRSSGAGGEAVLRIATGRSLARTLVADWIARLRHRTPKVLTEGTQVELSTGKAQDLVVRLEQGKVDLLCCYEHPALSVPLSPARYRYMTLATD